jgi:hypothetical protein
MTARVRQIWQNSVKSVSNKIEAYTKRNSKRMVRMDSPCRGASFSCRTHVSTIHGCGTMKDLWESCLEEGERKLNMMRERESWYRRWPLLAHGSQRRGWLWEYARFGGILRACVEGALRTTLTTLVRPLLFRCPRKKESSLLIRAQQPPYRMPNAPLEFS